MAQVRETVGRPPWPPTPGKHGGLPLHGRVNEMKLNDHRLLLGTTVEGFVISSLALPGTAEDDLSALNGASFDLAHGSISPHASIFPQHDPEPSRMDHHDPEHRRTGQDGELVEPGVAPTNFAKLKRRPV
jgi:hypothetical protein